MVKQVLIRCLFKDPNYPWIMFLSIKIIIIIIITILNNFSNTTHASNAYAATEYRGVATLHAHAHARRLEILQTGLKAHVVNAVVNYLHVNTQTHLNISFTMVLVFCK